MINATLEVQTCYRTDLRKGEAEVVLDPYGDRTTLYIARADDISQAEAMANTWIDENYGADQPREPRS